LKIDKNDFASLVEMWILFEIESAKIAAHRRTDQDILDIKNSLDAYANKVILGEQALKEDLIFHLKIAEATKNSILKSLIEVIRPTVFENATQLKIYKDRHTTTVLNEHKIILKNIIAQKSKDAGDAMRTHLKNFLVHNL